MTLVPFWDLSSLALSWGGHRTRGCPQHCTLSPLCFLLAITLEGVSSCYLGKAEDEGSGIWMEMNHCTTLPFAFRASRASRKRQGLLCVATCLVWAARLTATGIVEIDAHTWARAPRETWAIFAHAQRQQFPCKSDSQHFPLQPWHCVSRSGNSPTCAQMETHSWESTPFGGFQGDKECQLFH